jgi:hypothetical protein
MDFANQTQAPMAKGLISIVTNVSVFLRRLRFIQVDGFAYRYNREQTLGGIAFRNLNASYGAGVSPTGLDPTTVGVINPEVEALAIFGGAVQTDRMLLNKQGDQVRASRIAGKIRRASLFFDKYCIQGDPSVYPGSFMGLNARLQASQLVVSGDGNNALNSNMTAGPVVLNNFVSLQDAVVGADNENKVLIMNKAVRRSLSSQVRAEAHGMGVFDASGTQIQRFNGSPIEVIDEDGDDQVILTNTETFGGNNATASAYCIRFGDDVDETNVQGLVGSEMIEHVQVGLLGTYFLDLIEGLMSIAVFHPRAAARLVGISGVVND